MRMLLLLLAVFAFNAFGASTPYQRKDEQMLQKAIVKGTAGSMAVVNSSGRLAESNV